MKLFKYMSWLLVAMTLTIGLAACSNDDDDDDVSGGKSELVGKWEREDSYIAFKLDANGKGYLIEYPYVDEPFDITWKYKNNRLILTGEDDEIHEILHITYMDEDIMMFYYEEEGEDETDIFYKVRKFSWE